MVSTGWGTCKCGTEYYIEHVKRISTERGDTLECPSCGMEIARWGKGTDDYYVRTKDQMQRAQEEWHKAPICRCNNKMVLRTGQYGSFYGCANYPNGCNTTYPYK